MGVAGSESRCDLLSKIAESLQLCAMDVNWEIRDSCIELIDFMATKQGKIISDTGCDCSLKKSYLLVMSIHNCNPNYLIIASWFVMQLLV